MCFKYSKFPNLIDVTSCNLPLTVNNCHPRQSVRISSSQHPAQSFSSSPAGRRILISFYSPPQRMGRDRPNHFLAIRLTDPALLESLWKVQDQFLAAQPSLRTALVPLLEAHITLNVFHVEARLKFLKMDSTFVVSNILIVP